MIEPTYTLTLTESERTGLARALGLLVTKLVNAPVFVEAQPASGIIAPAQDSPSAPPAAASRPTPTDARDRWARDRKGNELPNPDGCSTHEVDIWKTENKTGKNGQFLKITWQAKDRGYVDASCFDQKLIPWIVARHEQRLRTVLHLVQSGKYLNVVGVRA